MSYLLKTKKLSKHFKTPRGMLYAVDEVSLNIKAGTTIGVVGESGCGKSTLGRTIVKLLEPTGGSIEFDGKDITDIKKKDLKQLRQEMQLIFQDPFASLNPRMNVFDLIAEPIRIQNISGKENIENEVLRIMTTVGLDHRFLSYFPHELDGGRRQRVGIARALSVNPKFIVCDEPVSALDVSVQAQILNLLQDLQEEFDLTLMFITHDMSVVKHISDELIVMYLGTVVESASTEKLFKNRVHPYTRALLSAVPIPSIHVKRERVLLKGEISSPIDPPDTCRFAGRCEYVEEICLNKKPELKMLEEGYQVACHFAENFWVNENE